MADDIKQKIERREIVQEMKESYLDYAMSVIVARALPDVRDGLKPVHRRILYGMREMGLTHTAKLTKCAQIVGRVLGYYHPHGDSAVYDSLVRMAQDFNMRYTLVQGQGNFGSIDGDSAAAYRYTEARLTPLAEELLQDLDKDTVDFQPNYNGEHEEPKVLPAKVPNLLLNGSIGIAVGMATNIPTHNLGEVCEAVELVIDNPKVEVEDILKVMPGPDFPTGGTIYNKKDIREAYGTGKGSFIMRGTAEMVVEEKKQKIIITEIPYGVVKSSLLEKFAQLITDKKIEGVRDLRDESDKEGMRIVFELKNDAEPQKILNQLYQYTDLQKAYHMNLLALVGGIQPQTLSIKEVLEEFVAFRKEVIRRRTEFDLARAKEREHILEGLSKAIANIDAIIKIIRSSKDREAAEQALMKKFKFTELQTKAILDMRLAALVNLERYKIEEELKEKRALIKELTLLLKEPKRILGVIKKELKEVKDKHGDDRRTKVHAAPLGEFSEEDLIADEEVIISLTTDGYIKRLNPSVFRVQKRGGKGVQGSQVAESDDATQIFFSCQSHDILLFFSNQGKVYRTRAYEIPESARTSKGKAILNFLSLVGEEKINAVFPLTKESRATKKFLILVTKHGIIKKIELLAFENVKKSGLIAIKLKGDDELISARISSGTEDVFLVTKKGQSIRFKESQVRPMSRNSSGIKAMRLRSNDSIVSVDTLPPFSTKDTGKIPAGLFFVTEDGYAKISNPKEYRLQNRGGSGIKATKITSKTGDIAQMLVTPEEAEDLIVVSVKGQVIRVKIATIPRLSRMSQGVRVLKLDGGDKVVSGAII